MSTNVVPLKTGGSISAIIPSDIEQAFRLGNMAVQAGFAPKGDTAEAATAKIVQGMECGLPPMFSLRNIAIINGRPTIWGDAVPALLWGRGFKIKEWMSEDAKTAHCMITRPDGSEIERTFSEANARKAGLWDKAGPWKQYPERMLQMRARGFAARDGAADVLGGLWIAEEAQDIDLGRNEYSVEKSGPPEIPDIPDEPSEPIEPDTSNEALAQEWLDKLEGASPFEAYEIEQQFQQVQMHLPPDVCSEIQDAIDAAKGDDNA